MSLISWLDSHLRLTEIFETPCCLCPNGHEILYGIRDIFKRPRNVKVSLHSDKLVAIATPQIQCVLLGKLLDFKPKNANIKMVTKSTVLKITKFVSGGCCKFGSDSGTAKIFSKFTIGSSLPVNSWRSLSKSE